MVRMDFAVRPCRPITLPRSSGATRNSRTVTCSPSTARTDTCSGRSTSAFAISSTRSFTAATSTARQAQREKAPELGTKLLKRLAVDFDASRRLLVAQEAADGLAGLGSTSEPVLNALGVQLDFCRFL